MIGIVKMWVVLIILLGIYSYWDVKKQQLPIIWLAIGGGLSVGVAVINIMQGNSLWSAAAAVLPGLVFLVLTFLTREKIGYGDGCLVVILGNMVGLRQCLLILSGAIFLCFCFSCLLLVVFKKSRDYQIPFAPFCLGGTILALLLSLAGV